MFSTHRPRRHNARRTEPDWTLIENAHTGQPACATRRFNFRALPRDFDLEPAHTKDDRDLRDHRVMAFEARHTRLDEEVGALEAELHATAEVVAPSLSARRGRPGRAPQAETSCCQR